MNITFTNQYIILLRPKWNFINLLYDDETNYITSTNIITTKIYIRTDLPTLHTCQFQYM